MQDNRLTELVEDWDVVEGRIAYIILFASIEFAIFQG